MARGPKSFATPAAFRAWLARHHATARELLVRCFKVHARGRGIGYLQALDEALCYGWIDGVRRALDADSFSQRFSPRRPGSRWSAPNVRRALALEAAGRLRPAGLAAFRARAAADAAGHSYGSRPAGLDAASLAKLRADRRAWSFYQAQPPWYRRTSAFWVTSAKREETRARRLATLIASSARGRAIPPLARAPQRLGARKR